MAGVPVSKSMQQGEAKALLTQLEAEGRIIRWKQRKSVRLVWADNLPSSEEVASRLRNLAARRGAEGLTAKDAEKEAAASLIPQRYQQVLDHLIRTGEWVERKHGKSVRYYLAGCEPPDRATLALETEKAKVEEKLAAGAVWTEPALLGRGKGKGKAALKEWIQEGVRSGRLEALEVWTSASQKVTAYRLRLRQPEPEKEGFCSWDRITSTARALARRHLDGAVSFEEVAEALGVTPLVIKAAVREHLANGGGQLVLLQGEPSQVRDYPNARLEWQGQSFLRFRVLD